MAHVAHSLPGVVSAPTWLARNDIQARLDAALNSRVHRERWKYTNPKPVLEMLPLATTAPHLSELPDGVVVNDVGADEVELPLSPELDTAPEAYAAFCYQSTAKVVTVNGTPALPLTIDHGARSGPVILRLRANARLDLRETFNSDDPHQIHTLWVALEPGSELVHSRNSFSGTDHWQFLRVVVGRDALYRLHNHSTGARMRRQDIQIICAEAGAQAEISSAARVGQAQHFDQQITVEHTAPHTDSQQTVSTIAEDKAKVTFNGRIHIHANCNGVDAQLSNRNLIINGNATVNTKPELEIYTDDVKCAHGATIGQLDDDHLFYFASRGIDEVRARKLLGHAFLNTCIGGPLESDALAGLQASGDA